jgi:hypothetical protein
MLRDPHKRVTEITIDRHEAEVRVVLTFSSDESLVVGSEGLDEPQALLLADGYAEGLRACQEVKEEIIKAFLKDPKAQIAFDVPPDLEPDDRQLFERGAIGGLKLGTQGYWTDTRHFCRQELQPLEGAE